ncbi:MAG: transposase [Candidatus Endonucleobacter sp. (ex Gigantidas childressi)]|nr:transposase [Candidatus Endonucleobacter sp. (ex Gigantidas childressi)]
MYSWLSACIYPSPFKLLRCWLRDHLLLVGSRDFAYLLPSSNLKCFGYRDLLFCKFCHLELGGAVPEASTLGRFRTRLVEHRLWDQLLAEINR